MIGFLTATIKSAFATGHISGATTEIGGLVGNSGGLVENSFSNGSVTGNNGVGTLLGAVSGTVKNSFSYGAAVGTFQSGGVFGQNVIGSNVQGSYYDKDISTQVGGTSNGLSTVELKGAGTQFDAWDREVWNITSGFYPRLNLEFNRSNFVLSSVPQTIDVSASGFTTEHIDYTVSSKGSILRQFQFSLNGNPLISKFIEVNRTYSLPFSSFKLFTPGDANLSFVVLDEFGSKTSKTIQIRFYF